MTDKELKQLEKDARRPDYGGKYYKADVVLELINEIEKTRRVLLSSFLLKSISKQIQLEFQFTERKKVKQSER